MKILFITASRIGDAVLSAGLLSYIVQTYPEGKVTIACGPLAASLFEGYPQLERIIPLTKQRHHGHWRKLWRACVTQRWDIVIDLRNSVVSRLIRAKKRYIFGGHIDASRHKVEQNAAVMKLAGVPAPMLWFTEAQQKQAAALIGTRQNILAVGPAANWTAKTWPAERFADVVRQITAPDGPMPGAPVAVFAAPGEEDSARAVLNTVPAERQIDMIAKADPGTAAAALALCRLYIGNDSGLMHCAAAVNIKTLGLFGPSYPHLYRPWGDQARYVSTPENFDTLTGYEGYTPETAPCLMTSLRVETVMDAIKELIPAGG